MSELKATPGPYLYRKTTREIETMDKSDTQSYGMMLVVAHLDEYDHSEFEANGYLLAASYDLYEALKMALEFLEPMRFDRKSDDEKAVELDIVMRSALAKARGEQQ